MKTEPVEILLVEDNDDDVVLLRDALTGAATMRISSVVGDGVAALQYLRREPPYQQARRPGMILLDINMPRKNGFEVLAEMRADPALTGIPVVVLTSSERREDIARCQSFGVHGCIQKPVQRSRYARMVEEIQAFAQRLEPSAAGSRTVRILVVEDSPDDQVWIRDCLGQTAGLHTFACVGADSLRKAMDNLRFDRFDLVLLDLSLPDGRGLETLTRLAHALGQTPVIVLTGLTDGEVGLEAVKLGAEDYLVKDDCTASSLRRAVLYAVERHRLRGQLQESQREVRRLRGMLPICAGCKKIRDATGHWHVLEEYFRDEANLLFTHSICPDCEAEYREQLKRMPKP